jgi:hypothetical protein
MEIKPDFARTIPARTADCPQSLQRNFRRTEQFYTDIGKWMMQAGKNGACPVERFVSQQNIERYLKLLDISNDEFQRRLIFKLLSEEQEKLRNIVR